MDSDGLSEQKERDDLKPLKVILHGPPASGKTTLAKKICLRYGAHYVSVKSMIEETLQDLTARECCSTEVAYSRKRRGVPIRNVILLHDNVRPHTAALTKQKLEDMHWETLEHPPYSPDLSPCDYHLFAPMKYALTI
ncbi:unnamed protein product [Acanthoscelides obtectus]|uniref:ATPase AAA-type core domain-containing protein n=1 Tax=Acanthoscelides obtectus TaxID=200917 RepID=A0A9P0QGV2_ACAOB|nr:unnamed protein product [Acanthoscelides obtectus]CAK1670856.1 Mariner Mos1 transposase [Acanthoscelides obtectus]